MDGQNTPVVMAQNSEVPQNGKRRGKTGRVLGLVAVTLFVCAGIAALLYLMYVYLPVQYREQAERTYLPALRSAQQGDTVRFGTYEQDDDREDGAEDIEWIVLEREADSLLLTSRFALDCVPYNDAQALVQWEQSTLRQWLNHTFYDTAFGGAEKCMIRESAVEPDNNPNFDTDPGKQTTEKVFLLSISEVFRYFGTDAQERQCLPTAYARSKGAKADERDGNGIWWLRTPGFDLSVAARVMADGSINYCGYLVQSDFNAVRPSIRVTLNPDLFT